MGPPRRPKPWLESASGWLFLLLAPRMPPPRAPQPPKELAPYEFVDIPRRRGAGVLTATFFPQPAQPGGKKVRGKVLLLHPWLPWGRTYFHRYGRLEALREAGYEMLIIDFPSFGGSGPPRGYFDNAVADALDWFEQASNKVPMHIWGVSSGGYWAQLLLSDREGVSGAIFEDVSSHLLQWSWRMAPLWRPVYLVFRTLFWLPYRFLDLRRHAAHLKTRAVAYVSGALDPGVLEAETRKLAELAEAPCLIVPRADHLEAIKKANSEILELALTTFSRAEKEP